MFVGDVDLAPDGSFAIATRRTVEDGKDVVRLERVPWSGGPAQLLTGGGARATRPRIAPDGRAVAFLSDREKDVTQAFVLPLDGGEARRVTGFRHGVSDLAWLPDGSGLVVLASDDDAPGQVGPREEDPPTARVVRRIDWREDGSGLLERPSHVHLVPLDGDGVPVARRLTSGWWSASRPRPAVDGRRVLFLADPRADGDLTPSLRLHGVDLEGGDPVELPVELPGPIVRFAVEADGGLVVAATGVERPSDDDPQRLWRVEPDGAARCLTGDVDRWFGVSGTESDLHDWHATFDDAGRVTTLQDGGCVVPVRVGDGAAAPLVDRALDPVANALAAAGDRVAVVLSLGGAPPELYALEPGHEPRALTAHGDWLPEDARPRVDVLDVPGDGGPIRAYVVSPPDAGDEPLPTILDVHGGPLGAWGPLPPLEAILLAQRGYRVVLPNPRGSYDQGAAWVRPLRGDWGGVDADDCHAVLDALVERGLADPDRLGVIGLSYGGFVTNWLVGTSDRFRAAVSENGVANQVSAWANSDCGPDYCVSAELGDAVTRGRCGVALAAVATATRRQHPHAAPDPAGRGGSALPGRGRGAALRRAALAAARGGARPVPRGVPRVPGHGTAGPARGPACAGARLVCALPSRLGGCGERALRGQDDSGFDANGQHMSGEEIGVLLVDDDAIVRDWVAAALGGTRYRVRGSAASVAGVADVLARRGADLLLVDQRLPDGLGTDLVRELRRQGVPTPAILMTANAERGLNEAARAAGLQGSVLKTGSRGDLLDVMDRVVAGETAWDGRHPARTENPVVLSPRERAALELIAAGATNREAAEKLGVEPETVKTLLARAFRKLGARRRAEAVANAKQLGIL